MTVAISEHTRATALGAPGDLPLWRRKRMPIGHAMRDAGAQERSGPAAVLRHVQSELPESGPGDVLKRVHRVTGTPHVAPPLRGAAYIAALDGDPWRPQV